MNEPLDHDVDLSPIAGVDLQLYAAIIRRSAIANHDISILPAMAALHGIDSEAWSTVHDGWSRRIEGAPEIGALFHALYHS